MRISENRLRKIIRNILLESASNCNFIPKWSPQTGLDKEVFDEHNSFWKKAEPYYPPAGWTPDEDESDKLAVEAADKLNCELENLYIYMRLDEYEEYEEDKVCEYIDLFVPGLSPDDLDIVKDCYIVLRDSKNQVYLYACSDKREEHQYSIEGGEGWDD